VAVNDAFTTQENTPRTVNAPGIVANDTDADGDAVSVALSTIVGPANGTLTPNANGSFTYTPNANWSGSDGCGRSSARA